MNLYPTVTLFKSVKYNRKKDDDIEPVLLCFLCCRYLLMLSAIIHISDESLEGCSKQCLRNLTTFRTYFLYWNSTKLKQFHISSCVHELDFWLYSHDSHKRRCNNGKFRKSSRTKSTSDAMQDLNKKIFSFLTNSLDVGEMVYLYLKSVFYLASKPASILSTWFLQDLVRALIHLTTSCISSSSLRCALLTWYIFLLRKSLLGLFCHFLGSRTLVLQILSTMYIQSTKYRELSI